MSDQQMTPRRGRGRNVSLHDVSRIAGVSIASASRVLNGSPHPVSEELRSKVLAAAASAGFVSAATPAANSPSRIIGIIVQDSMDPYFAEISRGIEETANRAGYLTIVCNADRQSEIELAQLRLLLEYGADGVVFAASGLIDGDIDELSQLVAQAQSDGVSIVALGDRRFESSVITFDNEAASYDLTHDLLRRGSRRIAFVSGLHGVAAAEQRRDGYIRAMREDGLEPLVVTGTFASESGSSAALRMLAAGPLPDAIIGANDQTAVGVMTSLRNSGIQVPGDVLVAGIGSTSLAKLLDLTTVGVHLRMLGSMAARAVLEPAEGHSHMLLPHSIERRSSTATIPKDGR